MNFKQLLVLFLVVMLVGCMTWDSPSDKVKLGMSKEEVMSLCGSPLKINTKVDGSGQIELWVYPFYTFWTGYDLTLGCCTIYFESDVISSIQY